MFCCNCGIELSADAKFCSACGQPVGVAAGEARSGSFSKEETIVLEHNLIYHEMNGVTGQGRGILTNRRFIFSGKYDPSSKKVFTMGIVLANVMREKYEFEIAAEEILEIKADRQSVIISTRNGDTHKLGFLTKSSVFKKWMIGFQNLLVK